MSVSFALPNETSIIMIVSDEWHCILLSLGHTAKLMIFTKQRFDMNHKSIHFRRKDWLEKARTILTNTYLLKVTEFRFN